MHCPTRRSISDRSAAVSLCVVVFQPLGVVMRTGVCNKVRTKRAAAAAHLAPSRPRVPPRSTRRAGCSFVGLVCVGACRMLLSTFFSPFLATFRASSMRCGSSQRRRPSDWDITTSYRKKQHREPNHAPRNIHATSAFPISVSFSARRLEFITRSSLGCSSPSFPPLFALRSPAATSRAFVFARVPSQSTQIMQRVAVFQSGYCESFARSKRYGGTMQA